MAKDTKPTTSGSNEWTPSSWDEFWAKRTAPDGFVHWKEKRPGWPNHVEVPPLFPGTFPPSLERMRIEVSQAWRALGYSPSINWVEKWILKDLHHAQDLLDGKITFARNPWEHVPNDET